MRRNRDENSNPWMAYTDLGVALVSLFILAFVAMATLKEQKAEDLTRTSANSVSAVSASESSLTRARSPE